MIVTKQVLYRIPNVVKNWFHEEQSQADQYQGNVEAYELCQLSERIQNAFCHRYDCGARLL